MGGEDKIMQMDNALSKFDALQQQLNELTSKLNFEEGQEDEENAENTNIGNADENDQ
jgi:hypothetical protein